MKKQTLSNTHYSKQTSSSANETAILRYNGLKLKDVTAIYMKKVVKTDRQTSNKQDKTGPKSMLKFLKLQKQAKRSDRVPSPDDRLHTELHVPISS